MLLTRCRQLTSTQSRGFPCFWRCELRFATAGGPIRTDGRRYCPHCRIDGPAFRPGTPTESQIAALDFDTASAIAIKAEDGAALDLAAGDSAAGTAASTLKESFGASPGYSAETMTLEMIQVFLYVTCASKGYLLRDGMFQAMVILALSMGVGAAATARRRTTCPCPLLPVSASGWALPAPWFPSPPCCW